MNKKFQYLVLKLLLLSIKLQLTRVGMNDIDINKRPLIRETEAYVDECKSAIKSGF
jgi:hypothetical protein